MPHHDVGRGRQESIWFCLDWSWLCHIFFFFFWIIGIIDYLLLLWSLKVNLILSELILMIKTDDLFNSLPLAYLYIQLYNFLSFYFHIVFSYFVFVFMTFVLFFLFYLSLCWKNPLNVLSSYPFTQWAAVMMKWLKKEWLEIRLFELSNFETCALQT